LSLDRLTVLDQVMLGASERWPQEIAALLLLEGDHLRDAEGRFHLEIAQAAIEARLGLVPRFRQLIHRPRWGLGPPLWVDVPTFEISQHVREHPLAPEAGENGLLVAVEQLRRLPLDPSRPLWELWFLTGLPGREVGLFVRIHHAIADGMAAMTTMVAFLDPEASAPPASGRPWAPAPWPSNLELLTDRLRRDARGLAAAIGVLGRPRASLQAVIRAWPATREVLAERPGPATSLDRMVGDHRRFALLRASLHEVRSVARSHDATVNDVLLTVTAGGLRALLAGRGEPVADLVLPIYVPVSLRRRLRGPQHGNRIGQMVVPLPLGLADPEERLRTIAAETSKRKARSRPSIGILMHGRIARRLMLKAVLRQRVNVMSACLPGPKRRLYLGEAPVLEVFPLLPLVANEALGVGAMSYAGSFEVGITADRDAYPDLAVLVGGVLEDLRTLGITARSPLRPVDSDGSGPVPDRAGVLAPDEPGERVLA